LWNTSDEPVPWEQALVVGIEVGWGLADGPRPEIVEGTKKEDVIALLGAPDLGGIVQPREIENMLEYYGMPVARTRLLDMGWTGYEHVDTAGDNGIIPINSIELQLVFDDNEYWGGYRVFSGLNGPFDPDMKRPGSKTRCPGVDDKSIAYSHELLIDFLDSDIWSSGIGRAAEYVINGDTYIFGVSHEAECARIAPDASVAQQRDDYLLATSAFEPMEALELDPVSSTSEPYLLWSRTDSAAAVLVFRGQGGHTGDDVVQVLLNYCDWERGIWLSFFFSVIGAEPGVAISKGAETFLLSMVSDVAKSVTAIER